MKKKDLIVIIKRCAIYYRHNKGANVMWDFVAEDILGRAEYKASDLSVLDVEMAIEEVRAGSERAGIQQLKDEIAQQEFYLENLQKDLKDHRLRLRLGKRGRLC